jgi:hypothetical protein
MKTPGQLLLEQHEAATAGLDSIRRRVIAEELRRPPAPGRTWVLRAWDELLWTSRGVWLGLAAVWAVMLAINWAIERGHPASGGLKHLDTALILQHRREYRQLMAELGEDRPSLPVVPAAVPTLQRPRSERPRGLTTRDEWSLASRETVRSPQAPAAWI